MPTYPGRKVRVQQEVKRAFNAHREEYHRIHGRGKIRNKRIKTVHLSDFVDQVLRLGLAALTTQSPNQSPQQR